MLLTRALSSAGRASRLHREGREFEPLSAHHFENRILCGFFSFKFFICVVYFFYLILEVDLFSAILKRHINLLQPSQMVNVFMKNFFVVSFLKKICRDKELLNLALIVLYVALAFFLNEFVQNKPRYRMSFFLSMAFLLPVFLFPKQVKIYLLLFLGIVYIPTLINVAHIVIFGEVINPASLRCIFNTNWAEAWEFIVHFSSWQLAICLLAVLTFALLAFRTARPVNKLNPNLIKFLSRFCYLCLILTICKGAYTYYDRSNQLPVLALRDELHSYNQEVETTLRLRNSLPEYRFRNIKSSLPDDLPQTYVLVIGESLNRNHMSLYGYQRETSPLLKQIQNELLLFDNVYSPHATTLASLTKVLSFANDDAEGLAMLRGSLVDYFKDAGFKTFWISNQFDSGENDDLLGVWGHAADEPLFINKSYWRNLNAPFDEKVIPVFETALQDKAPKKLILVHLMGSHTRYTKRYPNSFNKFSGDGARALNVAQYDNSVLYNDFVVRSLIETLRKYSNNHAASLLYLSDHGEDVSEAPDSCHCHSEVIASEEMFQIPFIVWNSSKYNQIRSGFVQKIKSKQNVLFNSENLIHAFAELAGLKNKDINPRLSLFADNYKIPDEPF